MKRTRRVLLMLRPPQKIRADYLILSLLFALGIVAGHLVGGSVTDAQIQELSLYLTSYTQGAVSARNAPLAGVLFSYFRSPVLFFLAGLASCGVWLIPLLTVGQGFFFAFSVRCFSAAMGRSGILLAFAAFGIRCLFVLPCCFYLASRSWAAANQLRSSGRVRELTEKRQPTFYPLLICGLVLLTGCVIELSLVPRLFAWIAGHIT